MLDVSKPQDIQCPKCGKICSIEAEEMSTRCATKSCKHWELFRSIPEHKMVLVVCEVTTYLDAVPVSNTHIICGKCRLPHLIWPVPTLMCDFPVFQVDGFDSTLKDFQNALKDYTYKMESFHFNSHMMINSFLQQQGVPWEGVPSSVAQLTNTYFLENARKSLIRHQTETDRYDEYDDSHLTEEEKKQRMKENCELIRFFLFSPRCARKLKSIEMYSHRVEKAQASTMTENLKESDWKGLEVADVPMPPEAIHEDGSQTAQLLTNGIRNLSVVEVKTEETTVEIKENKPAEGEVQSQESSTDIDERMILGKPNESGILLKSTSQEEETLAAEGSTVPAMVNNDNSFISTSYYNCKNGAMYSHDVVIPHSLPEDLKEAPREKILDEMFPERKNFPNGELVICDNCHKKSWLPYGFVAVYCKSPKCCFSKILGKGCEGSKYVFLSCHQEASFALALNNQTTITCFACFRENIIDHQTILGKVNGNDVYKTCALSDRLQELTNKMGMQSQRLGNALISCQLTEERYNNLRLKMENDDRNASIEELKRRFPAVQALYEKLQRTTAELIEASYTRNFEESPFKNWNK